MAAIQITGRITGGPEVVRRMTTTKDAVREALKKELRAIGSDLREGAKVLAPFGKGRRSRYSLALGHLRQSIKSKLETGDRANLVLHTRPTNFYALFIEGGWTKAPFRKGNRKADGTYGAPRQVKVRVGGTGTYYAGEKEYLHPEKLKFNKKGKEIYRPAAETGEAWKVRYTNRPLKHFTYKKTTHIGPRPFMAPVARLMERTVPGRLNSAVADAMKKVMGG